MAALLFQGERGLAPALQRPGWHSVPAPGCRRRPACCRRRPTSRGKWPIPPARSQTRQSCRIRATSLTARTCWHSSIAQWLPAASTTKASFGSASRKILSVVAAGPEPRCPCRPRRSVSMSKACRADWLRSSVSRMRSVPSKPESPAGSLLCQHENPATTRCSLMPWVSPQAAARLAAQHRAGPPHLGQRQASQPQDLIGNMVAPGKSAQHLAGPHPCSSPLGRGAG